MLVVGNVIGAGIFLVGGFVAKLVHTPAAFLGLWFAGGVFALSGALCNGELGAMFPRGGGEYVYLRNAYGPMFGFLSGWTSFWIGFPGSIATLAAGFGEGFGALTGTSVWGQRTVSIAIVVALTVVNALGLRQGKLLQNVLSVVKVIAFAAALVAGAIWGVRQGGVSLAPHGPEHASDLAMALIPIYFAYSGWNAACYVAGEMKNPGRDLGRALALGTLACVVLYLAVNAAFLVTMGLDGMRSSTNVGGEVAAQMFGRGAGVAVTVIIVIAVLSSLQATVIVGPRIYHAMAEDGLFPERLSRLHPKTRVPVEALALQGIVSCALLLTGGFDKLLTFTTFALVLFSIITVAAVPVLRVRAPDNERPFRTPGYPLTPLVYIAGNAWVLYVVVASGAREALVGLAIVLSGVPFYMYFRKKRGAA